MSTPYTGDPAATEPPASAPAARGYPIVSLPNDGDALNAASVAQAYKVLADYLAYIQDNIALGPPPVSDDPQLLFYNTSGNVRSLVDHNGYPMGRRSELREEWIVNIGTVSSSQAPITGAQRWSVTTSGTAITAGALVVNAPAATYPCNSPSISTASGAGAVSVFTAAPIINTSNTFLSTVIEFEATAGTDLTAKTHSETFTFGLSDTSVPSSATKYCWLKASAGVANWKCQTANGGAPTSTDSGVSIDFVGTAPAQRWRIELHGSGSPYGSMGRFFINEVLVAENATTLPASTTLYLVFGASGASTADPITLHFGPVLATWNRFLTLPSL